MPQPTYAESLLAGLSTRWGAPSDGAELLEVLEHRYGEVVATLPNIELEVEVMVDALARAVDPEGDPWLAVRSLSWAELTLTAGVLAQAPAAVRAFSERYLSRVQRVVSRYLASSADQDDVAQTVREKVFASGDQLLIHAGRGTLASFLRMVASRSAIDQFRRLRAKPQNAGAADGRVVDTLLDAGLTPELVAAKQQHHATFKAAFESAVAALADADRGLLRLSVLQRLSIDEVAALHDIHRATAARRLTKIRDEIAERVRRELRFGVGLSATELRSLHQALDSQLELSLSRLFSPKGPVDDD